MQFFVENAVLIRRRNVFFPEYISKNTMIYEKKIFTLLHQNQTYP
jgi:hypothetical protein